MFLRSERLLTHAAVDCYLIKDFANRILYQMKYLYRKKLIVLRASTKSCENQITVEILNTE